MTVSRFSALAVALTLTLTAAFTAGCKKDKDSEPTNQTGTFSVEMDNTVGTQPLTLDSETYTTAAGDNFKVTTFKYYLSNFELLRADGSAYAVPNTYFLVDESKPASTGLEMPQVPVGDYTGLRFVVGVDSARTKALNYTGVLTAENGMWWDWSKEFINVKLEGTSPQSPSRGLIFHIAGYKGANGANNTIRTVTLPFAAGTKMLVRPDHAPEVHLTANVLGMFGSPNPVRFSTTYNTMSMMPPAGALGSVQIANNVAAGVFKVDHIHAN